MLTKPKKLDRMVVYILSKLGITYPKDAEDLDTEEIWKDITDYFGGNE